jgi:predicted nucleic acid binding AN1-type Zn finger protein
VISGQAKRGRNGKRGAKHSFPARGSIVYVVLSRDEKPLFFSFSTLFQIISFHVVALLIILELRKKTKDVDHGFIFIIIIIII